MNSTLTLNGHLQEDHLIIQIVGRILTRYNQINPICNRGGIKCPHYQESVRHFPMGNARITKTLDFVPLSTRHIPAKPFFKISIFKKNIKRCQKYPKGGPFCEFQIFGVLARNSVFLMA